MNATAARPETNDTPNPIATMSRWVVSSAALRASSRVFNAAPTMIGVDSRNAKRVAALEAAEEARGDRDAGSGDAGEQRDGLRRPDDDPVDERHAIEPPAPRAEAFGEDEDRRSGEEADRDVDRAAQRRGHRGLEEH